MLGLTTFTTDSRWFVDLLIRKVLQLRLIVWANRSKQFSTLTIFLDSSLAKVLVQGCGYCFVTDKESFCDLGQEKILEQQEMAFR